MGKDERRTIGLLDDLGNAKSLARTGNAEQDLMFLARAKTMHQLIDGAGLVAPGFVCGDELKVHGGIISERRTLGERTGPRRPRPAMIYSIKARAFSSLRRIGSLNVGSLSAVLSQVLKKETRGTHFHTGFFKQNEAQVLRLVRYADFAQDYVVLLGINGLIVTEGTAEGIERGIEFRATRC